MCQFLSRQATDIVVSVGNMAGQAHGAEATGGEVRLSRAAIDALNDLPKSQARAVARAVDYLRSGGEASQRLKFSLPGADGENYYALRTAPPGPVMIYRPLTEDEGGGYLVTAIVANSDFSAYERADQKGLLDTTLGKVLLGAAAAAAVFGARGLSRR